MLTPFLDDGKIDWNGLDALTDWYINSGAAGLFACCLSSEMYDLSAGERLQLIRRVMTRARGRVEVVAAGALGKSPLEQAEAVRRMADTGVRAVVLLTNQFARKNEDDAAFQSSLEKLMDLTGSAPLGFYECPVPYLRLVSTATLAWAAQSGRFLYMKDVSCNVPQITERIKAAAGTPLSIFNAHAPTLLDSLRAGADGFSGIAANCYPELFTWLMANWHEKPGQAEILQATMIEMDKLVAWHYPWNTKRLLGRLGLPLGVRCRLAGETSKPEDETILAKLLGEMKRMQKMLRA